jgi:hypothetical protein
MERLRDLLRLLLDARRPAFMLRQEAIDLVQILAQSASLEGAAGDISDGETRTSNGLAISPRMAAMCADDFVRTIKFLRGTFAAIEAARANCGDRPVRVLYVGSGPYGTLAIPLMAVIPPSQATFTLLDIHTESVKSARTIVDRLGLGKSVETIEALDAASYKIPPDRRPDVLLLETMQVCLEKEPQVALTRHLVQQAPDATLVPREIRIDLRMVDRAREFSEPGSGEGEPQRDRIHIGTAFAVNREAALGWREPGLTQLEGHTLEIPASIGPRYAPMLFTVIEVHPGHVIEDYESGLTCPRPAGITLDRATGSRIRFFYELGLHPRLRSEVRGGA